MGYDFSRFSSQSFEHFAQALATKQLGPGISVFGAGPDGAREASFQGPLPITTHGAQWNGYVVAQSKYKNIAKGGAEDAAWLQKELAADLDKFLDKKRNLKKPEYYLAITNIVLSSVVGGSTGRRGGQEKIEELFESYKERLGLKGWLVWHADLLSAMLDGEQEIRTRYAAWVTEGDVLASALAAVKRPDIKSVVPLALRRDLRKDRDIRRKDAGQVTNKRIYLEDVFVDLPLQQRGSANHYTNPAVGEEDVNSIEIEDDGAIGGELDEDSEAGLIGLVAKLVERCADKLDPQSLGFKKSRKDRHRGPTPNRIVLLGGPGQGKSTVAQFLAQVFRARASIESLRNEPPDLALEAAESILSRAEQEKINLLGPARYPMHVELPKFADAIKQASDLGNKLSLLRHCSNLLGRESDRQLDPADLRTWLGEFPWLLILDGLDEVPATGNRSDVVVAVNEFLDDVNQVNGDVLVVITTRPQGYGDDFPRRHWEHWSMGNLSSEDAMRFAKRLADVLLSDGSRRDEILAELRRASEDPATAPIMISPLQVSILFSLVETRGGVPADRWSLFQRHYILLRDREAAKEGETAKLLRDYASQIDQIHYDAGFLLHVRAEASGTANSFFSESEFETLIDRHLVSEGHSTESIESIKHRLVTIATDRLVLLGSKTGGQIAFDVRSLQEFMAAARIMSSPEAYIGERLSEISARTHWRHVFRIAASKAFALTDLTHLRRQIVHICDALDKGDLGLSDRLALSGARLSLDLLEDNVAARLPDIRRSLVTRSLEALNLGLGGGNLTFVQFLDKDTKQTFETEIVDHLAYAPSHSADAAFKLLLQIANRSPQFSSWAVSLILKAWPSQPADVLRLITEVDELPLLPLLRDKIFEAQIVSDPEMSIMMILRSIGMESLEENETAGSTPCLKWLSYFFDDGPASSDRLNVNGVSGRPIFSISQRLISTKPALEVPRWLQSSYEWRAMLAVAEFTANPNKSRLAAVCRSIAHNGARKKLENLSLLWPLDFVINETVVASDLLSAADCIERGAMGDLDDWLAAEKDWLENGIQYSAVAAWAQLPRNVFRFLNLPNIEHVRERFEEEASLKEAAQTFLSLLESGVSDQKLRWVNQQLSILIRRTTLDKELVGKIKQHVMTEKAVSLLTDRQFLRSLDDQTLSKPIYMERLNRIGIVSGLEFLGDSAVSVRLARLFSQRKELRGLLPLLIPLNRSNLTKQMAAGLQDISLEALQPLATDPPSVRVAIDMIRIIRGLDPVDGLVQSLKNIARVLRPGRLFQFARLIRTSPLLENERSIEVLTALCECMDSGQRPIETLKSKLDTRSSRFNIASVTNRLSLPSLSIFDGKSDC